MGVVLPDDILYIIFDCLKEGRDYNTIFQCALASRSFAEPALAVLYQLYDQSPVTGGGTEDEQLNTRRIGGILVTSLKNQESTIRKWALMWRSIIWSTFGKTYLPYYSYIRYLDLRDLKDLLADSGFKGQIRDEFMAGEIGDLLYRDYEAKGNKRLRSTKTAADATKAAEQLGSTITTKPNAIRELSGEVSPSALSEWIRNLPQLQALSMWSGNALGQHIEDEIRVNCPEFQKLTVFRWTDSQADSAESESERFIKGLSPNSLKYFEIYSSSQLGSRSITALSIHNESLVELKLTSLSLEAIAKLPSLASLPSLRVLALTDSLPTVRNEEFEKVVSEVAEWICSCKSLRHLTLRKFLDDPALLAQALIDERLRLISLTVRGYSMSGNRAFHSALAHQTGLEMLSLQGEGSEFDIDQAILVQALGQLTELHELELKEISDYFSPDHVMMLTPYLPNLERLWISGYEFDDSIWIAFLNLPHLKTLIIHALSTFTAQGVLDFITQLGPGNQGFSLSILNALNDKSMSDEDQELIRETISQSLNGNFDFGLAREEYTESESGSDISN